MSIPSDILDADEQAWLDAHSVTLRDQAGHLEKWGNEMMLERDSALRRLDATERRLTEATWLLQHSEDADEDGYVPAQTWFNRRRNWLAEALVHPTEETGTTHVVA